MRTVPDWDTYWMDAASHASERSKDPSTNVGAVLVTPSGKDSITSGYNGFVPGAPDRPELWNNREEKYPRVLHAELNAICRAARLGRSTEGATLYTTHFPCLECAKAIAAAGIKRVVFNHIIGRGWDVGNQAANERLKEAGIEVTDFNTIRKS